MSRLCHTFLVVTTFLATIHAARAAGPPGDPVEGARIAAELRTMHPQSNTNWTGVLKRRVSGRVVSQVPLTCFILMETNRWLSVYSASATTNMPAEKLVVIRYFDGRAEYLHGKSDETPLRIAGSEAGVAFAGSDFYMSDLGLEFLQWPTQLLLPGEMRRGQPCFVLESVNPDPGEGAYARVRSWIQKEYLGLLMAEAYDKNGRLMKEFNAGSFDRASQQLKDMEIRSVKERSRTELLFDPPR